MRERTGREPGAPRPPGDDLRKITGVGRVVVVRLAEAGITTYQDLVALTAEQVAEVTGISVGRIVNQDWIGQAKRLVLDTSPSPMSAPRLPPTPSVTPLAVHLQGPGPAGDGTRRSFKLDNQPTVVRMTLGVDRSDAIDTDAVEFVAEVAARAVGGGNRHDLGSIKGTIVFDQLSNLELIGPPLPPALYSLAVDVAVYRHGYKPGDEPLLRHRGRGELLHVGYSAKDEDQSCGR